MYNANSKTHYKHQGAEQKAKLFGPLQEEIAKEMATWKKHLRWGTNAARRSPEYIQHMYDLAVKAEPSPIICGDLPTRKRFFERALKGYPQVYWTDECAVPTVRVLFIVRHHHGQL